MASPYATHIAYIKEAVDRIERKLDALNGSVDQHGEALAALMQWRDDHERHHDDVQRRLDALGKRVWAIGGVNGLLALISSIFGASR